MRASLFYLDLLQFSIFFGKQHLINTKIIQAIK